MHKKNVGDGPPGSWSKSNHLESLAWLFENFTKISWLNPGPLLYGNLNIERTASHLGLDTDTVQEWLDDPKFAHYKNCVPEFKPIDKNETETIEFLCNLIGLDTTKVSIFLQTLRPGGMAPWHLDGKKHIEYGVSPEQEHLCERHIIFLEDQHPGQMWQINDDYISWKKGDILTWQQSSAPHGTANVGYHDRHIIMISGLKKI